MTSTFITGDRSLSPVYGPLVAIEMMRALAIGDTIVTGDQGGVDALVRDFAERAGLEVAVLPTPDDKDWDARNEAALAVTDRAVAIHSAPESSSAIKSLLQNDDVRLVTHMDLMI